MSHGEATGNQVERTGGGAVAPLKYAAIVLLVIGPLSGVPFFLDDPLTATRGALRILYALLVLFDIVVGFASIFILVRLTSTPDFARWEKLHRWASIVSTIYVVCLIGGLLIADAFLPPNYLIKICLYFCLAFMAAKVVSLLLAQDEERRFFRQSFKPLLMKYSANAGVGVIIGVSVGLLRLLILGKIPLDVGVFHMVAWSRVPLASLIGIVAVFLLGLLTAGLSRAVNMTFVDAHGQIGKRYSTAMSPSPGPIWGRRGTSVFCSTITCWFPPRPAGRPSGCRRRFTNPRISAPPCASTRRRTCVDQNNGG